MHNHNTNFLGTQDGSKAPSPIKYAQQNVCCRRNPKTSVACATMYKRAGFLHKTSKLSTLCSFKLHWSIRFSLHGVFQRIWGNLRSLNPNLALVFAYHITFWDMKATFQKKNIFSKILNNLRCVHAPINGIMIAKEDPYLLKSAFLKLLLSSHPF